MLYGGCNLNFSLFYVDSYSVPSILSNVCDSTASLLRSSHMYFLALCDDGSSSFHRLSLLRFLPTPPLQSKQTGNSDLLPFILKCLCLSFGGCRHCNLAFQAGNHSFYLSSPLLCGSGVSVGKSAVCSLNTECLFISNLSKDASAVILYFTSLFQCARVG